jgi:excisionase family DNA binding protein
MENNKYITIPQMAKILGMSRIAVYKKVKKGDIDAIKIGRNFAIPKKSVANILGKDLRDKDKKEIDKAVKKTLEEYGGVLKRLGRE